MEGYWTNNGLFLLIGFILFPRVTLLFCNIPGNLLFWLGWFFIPRITVAIFATIYYLYTNPILVILSWIFAIGGESAEKKYTYNIKKSISKNSRKPEYEIIE